MDQMSLVTTLLLAMVAYSRASISQIDCSSKRGTSKVVESWRCRSDGSFVCTKITSDCSSCKTAGYAIGEARTCNADGACTAVGGTAWDCKSRCKITGQQSGGKIGESSGDHSGTGELSGGETGEPFRNRPSENQPAGNQPFGNQQFGNQPFGNQPFGNQPAGNQPFGNKQFGNQPFGNQPAGNQPFGNYQFGNQPFGNQPAGNRPFENLREPSNKPNQELFGRRRGKSSGVKTREISGVEIGEAFGNQPSEKQQFGNQPFGNQPVGSQPFGNQQFGNQPFGNQPAGNQPFGDLRKPSNKPTQELFGSRTGESSGVKARKVSGVGTSETSGAGPSETSGEQISSSQIICGPSV